MNIPTTFEVTLGGRALTFPVVPLAGGKVSIALFDSQGDIGLCDFLAEQMLAAARARGIDLDAIDVILTAGKAITLAGSVARGMRLAQVSVAEKQAKNFWPEPFAVQSRSITGGRQEQLVIGGRRAQLLAGKRILIVDDVISTGESMRALAQIARHFGEAALIMAPFAEGAHGVPDEAEGIPAVVLAGLPVWQG